MLKILSVLLFVFLGLLRLEASPRPILQATIVPTTATTVQIPINTTADVQYQFTNRSPITRQFTVTAITGMSQVTTSGTMCANPFTLAYGESCLLTMRFTGSLIMAPITGGPEVCKVLEENDNSSGNSLCIQPATVNQLAITIVAAENASLSVTPSSLTLVVGDYLPQLLTVTNASTRITASSVQATLPGSWTDITQDASHCFSLPPLSSCLIELTPGPTSYAVQSVNISGGSSTVVPVSMVVNATPMLSVDRPSVTVYPGVVANLTVQNVSARLITNVSSVLAGTPFSGKVTESGNTCSSLAVGQSCTLSYTASSTPVAEAAYTIVADNVAPKSVLMKVSSALAIGTEWQDGYVFKIDSNGSTGVVVSSADVSANLIWGGSGTAIGTMASSTSNGVANTNAIVDELTNNQSILITSYAAGLCSNFVSAGAYNDWYLPASDELVTIWTHSNINGGPIPGFNFGDGYWSSTEATDALSAWFGKVVYFGGTFNGMVYPDFKTNTYSVRCARAFS